MVWVVVNGVAFLALTLCSLVASKCLVVLPHGSCENSGFFFYDNFVPPSFCSFHLSWPGSWFWKATYTKGAVRLLCNNGKAIRPWENVFATFCQMLQAISIKWKYVRYLLEACAGGLQNQADLNVYIFLSLFCLFFSS